LGTDQACIKISGKRKFWNTLSILVEIRHTTRVSMGKTMMPKDALLISGKLLNGVFILGGGKHQCGECSPRRVRRHGIRGNIRRGRGGGRQRRGIRQAMAADGRHIGRPGRNTIGKGMEIIKGNIQLIAESVKI
jgi:hypothetical protein